MEAGEGRLKLFNASLLRGLVVLSVLCTETGSARRVGKDGGAGEEGRPVGRKKGDLSTFISSCPCNFYGF